MREREREREIKISHCDERLAVAGFCAESSGTRARGFVAQHCTQTLPGKHEELVSF